MMHRAIVSTLSLLLSAVVYAQPTNTTFTYQGELHDTGAPADGMYNMEFSLWSDAVAGSDIGGGAIAELVTVTEGVFTVHLDFGVSAFSMAPRWLEITVEGVTLDPRQPLTRAPYAIQTRGIFVNDSQYVGLGTTNPQLRLDIHGPGFPGAFIRLNGIPGGANEDAGINFSRDGTLKWHLFSQSADDGFNIRNDVFQPVFYANQDRHIGLGMNTPTLQAQVHVRDQVGDNFGVLVDSLGVPLSSIGLHAGPAGYSSIAKNTFFNGEWHPFDELGGAFLQQVEPSGVVNIMNAPAGAGPIEWQNALHIDVDGKVRVGGTGFINNNHQFTVHVDTDSNAYGGMSVNTDDTGGRPFYGFATGNIIHSWIYLNGTDDILHVNHDGQSRIAVNPGGNVGIATGSSNADFLLHVNGSAGKPGGGSWSVASDVRLKENIQTLEGALEQLLALRGVSFEYRDPQAIHELEGRRVGMVAQEVEAVFPDWVDERNDGYKALTFRGFEAITVEALRELHTRNQALEAQNSQLERRLELLATRLEAVLGHLETTPASSNKLPDAK